MTISLGALILIIGIILAVLWNFVGGIIIALIGLALLVAGR